ACNNESDSTVETDTTTTENTVTTTNTSTGDYAAQAETYRAGNDAGAYIDARTGTTVRINVDPQTGIRTNVATGEPVWRYIDTRTWQVYNGDSWDPIAEARREGNTIVFKAEDGSWVSYDTRWPNDETEMKDYKTKIGDTKVKVSEDGDIKVKDEKGKVKYDADDNKVKTDSSR
ncbi:MAG TPA: hypothetical protein VGD26_02400, partial [Chitinophagaceae bacterium]